MKLTDRDIEAMPPKSLQDPDVVQIYRAHEFVDAYALHTDKRVRETGYKAAVGSGDNWDSHGDLQRDFLIVMGMKPHHYLLEVGCGTGRLARKVAPFLEVDHYTGVDISAEAVRSCAALAAAEGWAERRPSFLLREFPHRHFDFAWAFSVFIHLPPEECVATLQRVAARLAPDGRFYWSFVPEERNFRSGLKQFRATLAAYRGFAKSAGLTFEPVPDWISRAGYKAGRWSGSQHVALSMRR